MTLHNVFEHLKSLKPSFMTVFITIVCIYAMFQPPAFNTTDGAVRDMVAHNIYEHGDIALRQVEEGQYLNNLWTLGKDGRPYIYFGLGQSLMELPFIALLDAAERVGVLKYLSPSDAIPVSAVMLISSALVVAFVFGIVRKLGYRDDTALKTAALVAFGSILWGLSRQSYDMVQASMGVLGAVYFIVSAQASTERRWLNCLAAGLIYGVALITRISAVTAAPALALLVLGSPKWENNRERLKAAAWCIAGGLAVVWVIPAYNAVRFGSILTFGYAGHAPYPGGPLLPGLAQWLFSPWQGMFVYMPILLALPLVVRRFKQEHGFMLLVMAVLFVTDLVFHAQYEGLGYAGWGPYYILSGSLILYIAFAEFFEHPRHFPKWQRGVISGLMALTLLLQLPSLVIPNERYQTYLAAQPVHLPQEVLTWSWEWSPLWKQAEGTLAVMHNLPRWQNYIDGPSAYDAETLLAELYSYNLPDWWWLSRVLHGGQLGLIVPFISAIGVVCLAMWLLGPVSRRQHFAQTEQ